MSGHRILVVEDEAIVAADIENKLRRLGYVVCGVAFSGEDAIRKAGDTKPDLVLMDVRLQGKMTGIEAASHIRKERDVPIVYVTAYTRVLLRDIPEREGKFLYVSKPFSLDELTRVLDTALSTPQCS